MVIRGFHVGPENFANRTLLFRSEGLLCGTVRARKGGEIFRIILPTIGSGKSETGISGILSDLTTGTREEEKIIIFLDS